MHLNNPHQSGYDFEALVKSLPELQTHVIKNHHGKDSINFSDPASVKVLNQAILKHHYGVKLWDIPEGFLCPPVPGRCDYICHLNDVVQEHFQLTGDEKIHGLDIGTGANLIYPIIATQLFKWHMVGSDIEPVSINWGKELLRHNANLKKTIKLRQQSDSKHIFKGIIQPDDYFHITLCNPPFHASAQEAMAGTIRKNKNLNKNKHKRGSQVKSIQEKGTLNFAGQSNELWCEGGELAFVKNMINESQGFKKQVGVFSCLISKKENLEPLTKLLKKLKGCDYSSIDMQQGNKISRLLLWYFH